MVISFKYVVNKGEKKARNACSGVKSDGQNGRVSKREDQRGQGGVSEDWRRNVSQRRLGNSLRFF